MKNWSKMSGHSFLHISVCGVMMAYLLFSWLALAWLLPLAADLRPQAPPLSPLERYGWSGILLVGGGVLYGLVYMYLGYNFYSRHADKLTPGRSLLLWPWLWWAPVADFCAPKTIPPVMFTVAVGNPHEGEYDYEIKRA